MVESDLPARDEFREDGVIVAIVTHPSQAKPIRAQRLDMPKEETMPSVPGGFKPFRLVINLKMVYADRPDVEVNTFDPPIEIRVKFKASDVEAAKAEGKPLSLGFWDGTQWIRFTLEKHQFHLEPASTPNGGGWGVVRISHWGDPPKAWGT